MTKSSLPEPSSKEFGREIVRLGLVGAAKAGLFDKVYLGFSGGKDSLAMAIWARENLADYCEVVAHYLDTCLEYTSLVEYIKMCTDRLGFRLRVMEHADPEAKIKQVCECGEKYGIPLFTRYCMSLLKAKLFRQTYEDYSVSLVGVRWGESTTRLKRTFIQKQGSRNWAVNPLLSWTEKRIYEYIKAHDFPLYWTYKYMRRLGCAICPMRMISKKVDLSLVFMQGKTDMYVKEFYDRWFASMLRSTPPSPQHRKRIEQLRRNWRIFNAVELNPAYLEERNIPNAGFYEDQGLSVDYERVPVKIKETKQGKQRSVLTGHGAT